MRQRIGNKWLLDNKWEAEDCYGMSSEVGQISSTSRRWMVRHQETGHIAGFCHTLRDAEAWAVLNMRTEIGPKKLFECVACGGGGTRDMFDELLGCVCGGLATQVKEVECDNCKWWRGRCSHPCVDIPHWADVSTRICFELRKQ